MEIELSIYLGDSCPFVGEKSLRVKRRWKECNKDWEDETGKPEAEEKTETVVILLIRVW